MIIVFFFCFCFVFFAFFLFRKKDSSPGVRPINGFQSNYGPTRRNNAAQYIASRTFQNQNDGAIAADVIFTVCNFFVFFLGFFFFFVFLWLRYSLNELYLQ